MAVQIYKPTPESKGVGFQIASCMIQLPDGYEGDWKNSYRSGNLSKLLVYNGKTIINGYSGFRLDVDTRRVDSPEEIVSDLAKVLPPFICVSVLFAANENYTANSIGPHMYDNYDLNFTSQLLDFVCNNPELSQMKISENIPLSLCAKEPHLLIISPDQLLEEKEQFNKSTEALGYYLHYGLNVWPVAICIEPLPLPSIEETLTACNKWTEMLGQSWFRAEELIAKYCPDAVLSGRLSKLINTCLWLYKATEACSIGSEEENKKNGGSIDAVRYISAEWRALSRLHEFAIKKYRDGVVVPKWNFSTIADLSKTIADPAIDALFSCFTKKRINNEQQFILQSLIHRYSLPFNPLAVVGTQISNIVLRQALRLPYGTWCFNTKKTLEDDGFLSLNSCGHPIVRAQKDSQLNNCCDICLTNTNAENLAQIYDRQCEIENCIEPEQLFGNSTRSKPIKQLWELAKDYLYIVDRYLKSNNLKWLSSIPSGIEVKILVSDDDKFGKKRMRKLASELPNLGLNNVEIRVVTCSKGPCSHPLHDRYIFSSDWGVSISSSLDAIDSNALWVYKIEDYTKMQQRYFDYFWDSNLTTPHNYAYGPRSFVVNKLI